MCLCLFVSACYHLTRACCLVLKLNCKTSSLVFGMLYRSLLIFVSLSLTKLSILKGSFVYCCAEPERFNVPQTHTQTHAHKVPTVPSSASTVLSVPYSDPFSYVIIAVTPVVSQVYRCGVLCCDWLVWVKRGCGCKHSSVSFRQSESVFGRSFNVQPLKYLWQGTSIENRRFGVTHLQRSASVE